MYRVWRKPQDRGSLGRTTRWRSRRLLLQNQNGHGVWIQEYNDEADAIIRHAPGRVLVLKVFGNAQT